jgi:phosphatidylserine/phosphatidylglycerophosphate/cardiolipin synthase-like enzyme
LRTWAARAIVPALFAALLAAQPVIAQPVPASAVLLENRAYGGELINRIRESKRRIICAFYLFKLGKGGRNLPAAIATELVKARGRGVEVTVILDGGRQVGWENLPAAGYLVKGGVNVVFTSRRHVVTHAKAVAIDDRWVLLGSHNLTQAALLHNNELSVLLDSPKLAAELRRYLLEIK